MSDLVPVVVVAVEEDRVSPWVVPPVAAARSELVVLAVLVS